MFGQCGVVYIHRSSGSSKPSTETFQRPPTIEESDRCVLKDNLVSLLHVHGLVGDLLPQGGDVLSFDRRLEELGQVLDGPFQISAQ